MGAEAPDNVNLTWLRSKIHVMKTASSDQAAAVESTAHGTSEESAQKE